jgi:GNAT superfamily N-acetyltransferase
MSKSGRQIEIRRGRPNEREVLEALQWRASLANDNDRPHLQAHPDAIQLPIEQLVRGQVFVAEVEGAVAGFAVVLPERTHAELDGLFVEPEMWRTGVGAALVQAATDEARRLGMTLMVIANPAARTFYERCGFAFEGEAQTRFGPGIRMSR